MNSLVYLTPHFTLQEMTLSQTASRHGIDNNPELMEHIDNLIYTCEQLEVIRTRINNPIYISSGYRCPEVNELAGGDKKSQHTKGQAADITCRIYTPLEFLQRIRLVPDLAYDQLILEYNSWVHVSFDRTKKPRQDVLRATWDVKLKKPVYSTMV